MSNSSRPPNSKRVRRVPHWFRPKRFWNHFAAFYPVRWEGWAIMLAVVLVMEEVITASFARAASFEMAVLAAAPSVLVLMLILDLITIQTGEYPRWWRHVHGR